MLRVPLNPGVLNNNWFINPEVSNTLHSLTIEEGILTVLVVVRELASKKTSSTDVGTLAPPEPPDVVLQCEVSVQVPPFPIQYLALMTLPSC
jgi:hypothetical protein